MDTAELQLLRDRLRVLEAAVGSNRAIGGGSSAGISASINQLQLPTEPDLDVSYVPIGDHLDTRFAPFLPHSGAGIYGQPGLLLERPLIGDAAYDTAKKGTAVQRFRSQIYRHDFSACAYLTLAADAAAGGFQLLQDAEAALGALTSASRSLPEAPPEPADGARGAEIDPGLAPEADARPAHAAAIEQIGEALTSLSGRIGEIRELWTSVHNSTTRVVEILSRSVSIQFTDLAPDDSLPPGARGFFQRAFTQVTPHASVDNGTARLLASFHAAVEQSVAKEAAKAAVTGLSQGGSGGGSSSGSGATQADFKKLEAKLAALEKRRQPAKKSEAGNPSPKPGGAGKGS